MLFNVCTDPNIVKLSFQGLRLNYALKMAPITLPRDERIEF